MSSSVTEYPLKKRKLTLFCPLAHYHSKYLSITLSICRFINTRCKELQADYCTLRYLNFILQFRSSLKGFHLKQCALLKFEKLRYFYSNSVSLKYNKLPSASPSRNEILKSGTVMYTTGRSTTHCAVTDLAAILPKFIYIKIL